VSTSKAKRHKRAAAVREKGKKKKRRRRKKRRDRSKKIDACADTKYSALRAQLNDSHKIKEKEKRREKFPVSGFAGERKKKEEKRRVRRRMRGYESRKSVLYAVAQRKKK